MQTSGPTGKPQIQDSHSIGTADRASEAGAGRLADLGQVQGRVLERTDSQKSLTESGSQRSIGEAGESDSALFRPRASASEEKSMRIDKPVFEAGASGAGEAGHVDASASAIPTTRRPPGGPMGMLLNPAMLAAAKAKRKVADLTIEGNKGKISELSKKGLETHPKSLGALECLANAEGYAKSDTVKQFALWTASTQDSQIQIVKAPGLENEHSWLHQLFIGEGVVRFPFNTGDSHPKHSLSPESAADQLNVSDDDVLILDRFSTCSRSCFVLVPKDVQALETAPKALATETRKGTNDGTDVVNIKEWAQMEKALKAPNGEQKTRFQDYVPDPGQAASDEGIVIDGKQYRLYSVKTGVDFVGSKYEGAGKGDKNMLEANSEMAMSRSAVLASANQRDPSIGFQTELLTVTAPTKLGTDGFQVRDLSCMKSGLDYLPGHAIPYAGAQFLGKANESAEPAKLWRTNFTEPLGRAKANLLFNYGLLHTSANAQNFLLGFSKAGELNQFVLRDVGDTSWHDNYVDAFLGQALPSAHEAYKAESHPDQKHRHLLHETSSGAYPAPHMVRLAAYSVGTHGFAEKLCENARQEHELISGVIDGFRDYCQALLPDFPGEETQAKPLKHAELDALVNELGVNGAYPNMVGDAYTDLVSKYVKSDRSPAELLELAGQVRKLTQDRAGGSGREARNAVQLGVNAEEFLVCLAVEKHLQNISKIPEARAALQEKISSGNLPPVVPSR